MKTRDEFAKAALQGLVADSIEYAEAARVAYVYADAIMAERDRNQQAAWPNARWGRGGGLTMAPPLLDLGAWPSTSCKQQEDAKNLADSLVQDCVPFHMEKNNDCWVFTVLTVLDDWRSEEDVRLGGGQTERLGGGWPALF